MIWERVAHRQIHTETPNANHGTYVGAPGKNGVAITQTICHSGVEGSRGDHTQFHLEGNEAPVFLNIFLYFIKNIVSFVPEKKWADTI